MLDLVRLSPSGVFPPGGEALYRKIGLLTEMQDGQEVIDVACGRGVSTSYFVSTFRVEAMGVEPDVRLIREAEIRAKEAGLSEKLHYQIAPLTDLPFKDGIFDVAVGELGLGISAEPARAIQELVRVTRPMGSVVLVQLIWTGNIDPERRETLIQHLGARPMLLVEWKQMLRDAGVVELVVEDWSDQASPFRPSARLPFPEFTQIFTFREKLEILKRAYQRWGWGGIQGAIVREQEVHRLLTTERVLGLSLIKGTKWRQDEEEGESEE